jgi:hypothetical protein
MGNGRTTRSDSLPSRMPPASALALALALGRVLEA